MDDYIQPKDAKKFVWGTPKSSIDQDNLEEEEEHYCEPYQHMPATAPAGQILKSSANKPNPASCGDTAKTAIPSGHDNCAKDFPPPPASAGNYHCLTLNGGTQAKGAHPNVVLRGSNQGSSGDNSIDRPAGWDGRKSAENSGASGQNWRGKAVVKRKSGDKIRPDDFLPGSNPHTSNNNSSTARGMNPNSGADQDAGPALYEDAWDTIQQQRKLEENLRLARSISCTSEKFEDALEFLPEDWAPSGQRSTGSQGQGQKSGGGHGQRKAEPDPDPVTGGTYEKAWDLNRNLEEKLRLLQMHPPDSAANPAAEDEAESNYLEPWDTAKKQRELEEKFQLANFSSGQHHHHHNQAPPAAHPVNPPKLFQPAKHSQVEESMYEEAWDTKKGHSQILQASLQAEGSGGSSSSAWSSHHSPHCIIGEQINAMIPLQNQDWYHGNISRDDAEKQLVVCKDGSYLLRDSSDRCHYTLSIKSPLQMIHIQIDQCQAPDGSMRYVLGKNSKAFRTVPAMIDFYTQHPMPIRGAEHMILLHPVQCHWSQANDDTRM